MQKWMLLCLSMEALYPAEMMLCFNCCCLVHLVWQNKIAFVDARPSQRELSKLVSTPSNPIDLIQLRDDGPH